VLIKLNIVSALVCFLLLRIEHEYSENITILRWKGGEYEMTVLYDAHYSTLRKNETTFENFSTGYQCDHSLSVAQNTK
jgi:hypothetical protein